LEQLALRSPAADRHAQESRGVGRGRIVVAGAPDRIGPSVTPRALKPAPGRVKELPARFDDEWPRTARVTVTVHSIRR